MSRRRRLTERARVTGVNGTRIISSHGGQWQLQRRTGKGGPWRNAGPPSDKASALSELGPRDVPPEPPIGMLPTGQLNEVSHD